MRKQQNANNYICNIHRNFSILLCNAVYKFYAVDFC